MAAVAGLATNAVRGQTAKRAWRVGIAFNSDPIAAKPYLDAFVQGMARNGYRVDEYVVEARYAEGRNDRYPAIVRELLRAGCDVLVAGPNTAVHAAKSATATVPIVMAGATDPELTGLVASLARPGANVTGLAMNSATLSAKRLQLLRELLPRASRVAYLVDPAVPGTDHVVRHVGTIAPPLAFDVSLAEASTPEALENVLASLIARRPDALMVGAAIVFWTHRRRVVDFCARQRMPAIYAYREPVVDGGLLSYAASLPAQFAGAASYVARILRGERPAELPVEQPTQFELTVNMRTADALGLRIPESLLALAGSGDVLR